MKIHTSYYGNIHNIPKDYFLVSSSGWIPDEIQALVDSWDKKLAPSLDIYNQYKENNREDIYIARFKTERLVSIDWLTMFEQWETKANNIGKTLDNIVLLCYESAIDDMGKNVFCHRHILAESIENEFKTNVNEIGYEKFVRVDYKLVNNSTDFLF